MKQLVIDPGSELSGYVIWSPIVGLPVEHGKIPNAEILAKIKELRVPIVCEFPYPRGELASWQLFQTCRWAGRFEQALHDVDPSMPFTQMNRQDVKMHICGSSRAKDPQIRQALIDRFGGESALAGPKCPQCKGKGSLGQTKIELDCRACQGGFVEGKSGKLNKKCPACKGTLKYIEKRIEACLRCAGSGKVEPGVLFGFAGDAWQALAVAVTHQEVGRSKTFVERRAEKVAEQAAKEARKAARDGAALQKVATTPPPPMAVPPHLQ